MSWPDFVRKARDSNDEEAIAVIADWCEEHDLAHLALLIRRGESDATQALTTLLFVLDGSGMGEIAWRYGGSVPLPDTRIDPYEAVWLETSSPLLFRVERVLLTVRREPGDGRSPGEETDLRHLRILDLMVGARSLIYSAEPVSAELFGMEAGECFGPESIHANTPVRIHVRNEHCHAVRVGGAALGTPAPLEPFAVTYIEEPHFSNSVDGGRRRSR